MRKSAYSVFSSLAIAAAALLIFSRASLAAIHYVPNHFGTIQGALDAASGGDTIIVRDGTYTGPRNRNLNFGGKALTLRSENGASNCTIDCANIGRGFSFTNGETAASVVEGFTITNGSADNGGGVYCDGASPTISGCAITLNTAGDDGGGIWLADSSASIIDCSITLNTAGRDGGGLYSSSSSPTVTNSSIGSNFAGRDGGGVYTETSTPTLIDCLIDSNEATDYGGGVDFFTCPTATVTNCLLTGNLAGFGGAVDCFESSPTLANCTLSGNTATEGGAISSYASTTILTDCILYNDTAATGAELALTGASTLTATYSNVQGGQASAEVEAGSTLVWGPAGMNHDPRFVTGPLGDYYLSQTAAGQALTSMCVDAGSDTAAALGLDAYTTRSDSVADSGSVDVGYHYPNALPGPLTRLNCASPGNESVLPSAPTFTWTTDGGSDNRYVVDLALSGRGPRYSTPILQDKSWTMPTTIWNLIPSGSYIYWRVRAADLSDTPLTILRSEELWRFYKP